MTRIQYLVANATAALLVILLFTHFFMSRASSRLGAQLNAQRNFIGNARQLQPILERIIQRTSQGAAVEIGRAHV